MFAELIDKIIDEYKADPRNKIFIDEETLLAAATEETGNDVTSDQLRSAIKNYLSGEMDGDEYSIYDGAIYACAVASNNCFGDPAEHEDDDGSFTAEIRPA